MIPEASIAQAWGAPPQANDGQYNLANTAPENTQKRIAQFGEQQSLIVGVTPTLQDVTQYTDGFNVPSVEPKYLDQGIAFEIDARENDVYIRFRGDAGGPATTKLNGRRIMCAAKGGEPQVFWLPGQMYRYMDIVADAAATTVVFRRVSEPRIRA